MADPLNFYIDSDYPMDKVVYLDERNWTSSNTPGGNITTIRHNLNSTPFMNGVCSTNNWGTVYHSGTRIQEGQIYTKVFGIGSDATNIYICGYLDYYSQVTAKVRLWGVFDDSTALGAESSPTTGVRNLLLSSDYNYPKLFAEGTVDATGSSVTVAHNLGFVPLVDLWVEEKYNNITMWLPAGLSNYYINILEQPYPQDAPLAPYVTTNSLVLRNGKFHYRIYYDKAI